MVELISTYVTAFISWVTAMSGGNQLIAAAALGGIVFAGRRLPAIIMHFLIRQICSETTVMDGTVRDREPLIDYIVNNESVVFSKHSRIFGAHYNVGTGKLVVISGLGWRLVRLNGRMAILHLSHQVLNEGYLRILRIYSRRGGGEAIIESISKIADMSHESVAVFAVSDAHWSPVYGNFTHVGDLRREIYRNQRQLINPEQYDLIHQRVERFVNNREYYDGLGIAYKECFFLYGPPGTGKSSIVRHFACRYNIPVIKALPGNIRQTRYGIKAAGLKKVIIVLDDIDEYLCKDEDSTISRIGGSIGDLINTLDGVDPMDGCLIFINTNDPAALNSKLYRPGRVDLRMMLDYPTPETVMRSIGYAAGSPMHDALVNSGLLNKLPISYVNDFRKAKTVEDVEFVLEDCKQYFELAKQSKE